MTALVKKESFKRHIARKIKETVDKEKLITAVNF